MTPLVHLDFRPSSYGVLPGPVEAILQNIKGDIRRQMIRDLLERGEPIEDALLCADLPPETRDFLSRVDPQWMGGEYLPGYRSGEVEIARMTLDSVTRDVVSIRARRSGDRYRYRVVDEYPESKWRWSPQSSRRPLTMAQLIALIDGLECDGEGPPDYTDNLRWWQKENGEDRDSVESWVTVTSDFYPDLEAHYARKAAEWVEAAFYVEPDERAWAEVECPIAADWENTWRDCTHRVCYLDHGKLHFVSPALDFRNELEEFMAVATEVGSEASEHSDDDILRSWLDAGVDEDEPDFWLEDSDEFQSEEISVDGRAVICVFAKDPAQAVATLREQLRSATGAAERIRIFGAAHRQNLPALERLVQSGVGIDTTDAQGDTVLTFAAREGLERVVEFALAHGADASHRDGDGLVAAELLERERERRREWVAAQERRERERREAEEARRIATEPPAHLVGLQRDLSAVRDRMLAWAASHWVAFASLGGQAGSMARGYANGRANHVETAARRLGTDVGEAYRAVAGLRFVTPAIATEFVEEILSAIMGG